MAHQTELPGLFDASGILAQDMHPLPAPTEKQLSFARLLAARHHVAIPTETAQDRAALSAWIETHKDLPKGRFSNYPSSKQVAFAERIARLKRGSVPPECFQDRKLMSRWIDSNKPR